MILVATLTVKPGGLTAFREYERKAAAIMLRHGGRIERTVSFWENAEDDFFREVHLVYFPSPEALAAYREDEEFKALSALREACIVSTRIHTGEPGPDYHAP